MGDVRDVIAGGPEGYTRDLVAWVQWELYSLIPLCLFFTTVPAVIHVKEQIKHKKHEHGLIVQRLGF